MKITRINTILIVILLFCQNSFSQEKDYNINDYIKSSGKTELITSKLQKLIDKCSQSGGGTIYFPAGDYLTGTITLKDNTFLNLASGATIYGSMDIKEYPLETKDSKSLFYADGATNFGIIGNGTVNGQGDFFWRNKKKPYIRPDRLVLFVNSKRIKINDLLFTNSPNWTIEVRFCDQVWIDGISIINERDSKNTDGIDPVSSKNVFISNCYINTGDDGICPKSIGTIPTENLMVTNCVIISDDSALKLGTRSETFIRDAVFSNIVIKNSDLGIALFMKDGGIFENIRFENIQIQTTTNSKAEDSKPMGTYPLFIDVEPRDKESKLGAIKSIYFTNISIDSQDGHCLFLGQPNSKIENLNLFNIKFSSQQRKSYDGVSKPRGVATLNERATNDFSNIASYFTFVHVDGLDINNLSINDSSENKNNERNMIWAKDTHQIVINDFRNKQLVPNQKKGLFHLQECSSVEIKNTAVAKANVFLELEGANTKSVLLHHNNFLNVKKTIEPTKEVDAKQCKELSNLL